MNLSKITSQYIDTPYSDLTCVVMVRDILQKMGINFPTEKEIQSVAFNKTNCSVDNHMDLYRVKPIYMQAVMLKLFLHFFEKVKYPKIGDVIFMKNIDGDGLTIWPCVYIGRNLAMASFVDVGVKTFRYKLLGKPFLIVRRKTNGQKS